MSYLYLKKPMPAPISIPPEHSARRAAKTILLTGFLVGTADGLAAIALTLATSGRSPVIVFQYIASGLMGAAAFSGGMTTAGVGILCHYFIALTWSAVFFLFHPFVTAFVRARLVRSVLYGTIIWVIMNLIVLPASLVQRGPFQAGRALTGAIILMLAVGWPIAFMSDRYYRPK